MATPTYYGPGQPLGYGGNGWLGRFGGFFGGGTPAYLGDGQPSQSPGFLGGSTPAYWPAPAVQPAENEQPAEAVPNIAVGEPYPDVMTCPIDPAAVAAGKIVIVIPRQCT